MSLPINVDFLQFVCCCFFWLKKGLPRKIIRDEQEFYSWTNISISPYKLDIDIGIGIGYIGQNTSYWPTNLPKWKYRYRWLICWCKYVGISIRKNVNWENISVLVLAEPTLVQHYAECITFVCLNKFAIIGDKSNTELMRLIIIWADN